MKPGDKIMNVSGGYWAGTIGTAISVRKTNVRVETHAGPVTWHMSSCKVVGQTSQAPSGEPK